MYKNMNRRMVIATIILSVGIMSSCNRLPQDIKLNDQLVAFAELSETNDTLWGVKDSFGLVVKPGRFHHFAMEGNVIIGIGKDDNLTYAFTQEGEYIGKFEIFTHWVENGDYYLGVKYKDRTFYFPKSGEIVKGTGVFFGLTQIFLEVDGRKCQIRDYYGNKSWTVPIPNAIILKEDAQDVYYILAPEDWDEPPYDLYDINGNVIKQISKQRYRQLIDDAVSLKAFERTVIMAAKNVK